MYIYIYHASFSIAVIKVQCIQTEKKNDCYFFIYRARHQSTYNPEVLPFYPN